MSPEEQAAEARLVELAEEWVEARAARNDARQRFLSERMVEAEQDYRRAERRRRRAEKKARR